MKAVNLFAYGDGENVTALGYCHYTLEGTDHEVASYLQSRVAMDHEGATQIGIGSPLSVVDFNLLTRVDPGSLLVKVGASPDAGYAVTHIVNGAPKIDEVADALSQVMPPDYVDIYRTSQGFDFTRLIDDDYLDAVRLLWSQEKYVSALKLVLSMIDTFGFVEFGPVRDAFQKWLEEYCDMDVAGVTPRELWELRNSLLHMTNLNSERVRSGSVERLRPVIAGSEVDIPHHSEGLKNFHMARFCANVLPHGVVAWIREYNDHPERYLDFIERYDTIVSEARFGAFPAASTEDRIGT